MPNIRPEDVEWNEAVVPPPPLPDDPAIEELSNGQLRSMLANVLEYRGRGAQTLMTERSSANITIVPRMQGAVHIAVAGGAAGQYFRKEDCVQFAGRLMEEAYRLAIMDVCKDRGIE